MVVAALTVIAMTVAGAALGGSSGGGKVAAKAPVVLAMLVGPAAEGGPDFTKGVNIGVKEINAHGGVLGRPLVVKISQKGLTPAAAVTAYRAAVADKSVLAAYLAGTSGALAIAAQVNRYKLPILEQAGNIVLVKPARPYVYSMSFDEQYPQVVLRWAVEHKNAKKIAVLHYTGDYSSEIANSLKRGCKALGCSVVDEQVGDPTASIDGLVPLLQKMKDSGADTYYIETLNPNGPKAARQLGMFDKTIITEQWLSVPALAEATGAAGEDMVFAGQKCLKPELAAKGDPTAAFCTSYRALWSKYYPNETYALFSVYGNDAVRTFAQAAKEVIQAGKPLTRENINAQLENLDGKLVTSHGKVVTSKTNHYLTGPYANGYLLYLLTVKNGKIDYKLAPFADPHGAVPPKL